jgi:hypothetical protein
MPSPQLTMWNYIKWSFIISAYIVADAWFHDQFGD